MSRSQTATNMVTSYPPPPSLMKYLGKSEVGTRATSYKSSATERSKDLQIGKLKKKNKTYENQIKALKEQIEKLRQERKRKQPSTTTSTSSRSKKSKPN